MSIELRIVVEGQCSFGIPYRPGEEPPQHRHRIECDWGRIEHTDPRPDRGEVGPLMLATRSYIQALLADGPCFFWNHKGGFISSATTIAGRTYAHIEWSGQRWTWELFEARWSDGRGPDDIMVGRWPD